MVFYNDCFSLLTMFLTLLELSAFYQQNNPFGKRIISSRVILFFQTGTEQCGESLIETCFKRSHEGFYQFVTRGIGLAVH